MGGLCNENPTRNKRPGAYSDARLATVSTHLGNLGKQLAALRKNARLTQVELARRAGVHPSTIARFEQGKTRLPGPDQFERIAAVLGVGVDALLAVQSVEQRPAARRSRTTEHADYDPELVRAFRGRLRPIRDFMIQADGLEDADRRLVIEAVAWAMAHIEAVKAWEDARQATIGAQQDAQQIAREHSNTQA